MGNYWVGYTAFATSTAFKTAAKIIGASAKWFECVEVAMFGDGTTAAADIQHECEMAFINNNAAGTPGASPTPSKKGQAFAASALTAGTGYSAEPTTYETNRFPLFAFNQRGGMRWAVPVGQGFSSDGAQSNLSVASGVKSSAAGTVGGNMHWAE